MGKSRGVFCFQAEDGIRDLVRSRGLGDVYKRQVMGWHAYEAPDPLQTPEMALLTDYLEADCRALLALSLIHI